MALGGHQWRTMTHGKGKTVAGFVLLTLLLVVLVRIFWQMSVCNTMRGSTYAWLRAHRATHCLAQSQVCESNCARSRAFELDGVVQDRVMHLEAELVALKVSHRHLHSTTSCDTTTSPLSALP